jgi:hypothetical protein
MTYITISRSKDNESSYRAAEKLSKTIPGSKVYRRGTKSIEKAVAAARRVGEINVIVVSKKGKKFVGKGIRIGKDSYKWEKC